jgi:hypothetical protein
MFDVAQPVLLFINMNLLHASKRPGTTSLGPLHLCAITRSPTNVELNCLHRSLNAILGPDPLSNPSGLSNHDAVGSGLSKSYGNIVRSE